MRDVPVSLSIILQEQWNPFNVSVLQEYLSWVYCIAISSACSIPVILLDRIIFLLVSFCRSIASRIELLGANTPELLLLSAAPNFCSRLDGLSKGQERLCTLYQDHMLSVAEGAGLAIKECQSQFQNRRWNCTAFDNKTDRIFGPIMKIGKIY